MLIFDAWDAADPLGTKLGELTHATDKMIRAELNGFGSGAFRINRHSPQAAWCLPDNLVRVKLSAGGAYVFAFSIGEGVDDVVSREEEGGEDLTRGGKGALAYLDRAVIYPTTFRTTTDDDGNRTWTDDQFGDVLFDLITEAQARGALPVLTKDFTGALDSAAVAWPSFEGEFTVPLGMPYDQVAARLQTLGLEIWMDAGLVLHAYNERGTDRSATVVFTKGVNIREGGRRRVHATPIRSRAIVQGRTKAGVLKLREVVHAASEADARIGRRESFTQYGATASNAMLDRVGDRYLASLRAQHDGPLTVGVYDDTLEPFTDYFEGDTVTLDIPGVYDTEAIRIAAITLDETEGGEYDVTVELGGISYETLPIVADPTGSEKGAGGGLPGSGSGPSGGGGGGGGGGGAGGGGANTRDCDECPPEHGATTCKKELVWLDNGSTELRMVADRVGNVYTFSQSFRPMVKWRPNLEQVWSAEAQDAPLNSERFMGVPPGAAGQRPFIIDARAYDSDFGDVQFTMTGIELLRGLAAMDRPEFWLAATFATGDANRLQRRSAEDGSVLSEIALAAVPARMRATPNGQHVAVVSLDGWPDGLVSIYDRALNLITTIDVPNLPSSVGAWDFTSIDWAIDDNFNLYLQGYGAPYQYVSKYNPDGERLWDTDLHAYNGYSHSATGEHAAMGPGPMRIDGPFLRIAGHIDVADPFTPPGSGPGWSGEQSDAVVITLSRQSGNVVDVQKFGGSTDDDDVHGSAVVRAGSSLYLAGVVNGQSNAGTVEGETAPATGQAPFLIRFCPGDTD